MILLTTVETTVGAKLGSSFRATTRGATATLLALTRLTSSSMGHLFAITIAQVACSGTLSTLHIKTGLDLLCCCIAIHQTSETVTEKFIEDGRLELLPKLSTLGYFSSILSQLHKPIIVVNDYHRALIESLKLTIYYQLVMVNIEVIILEQSLKYIPCHSLDIETISNSLPPSK